MAALLSLEDVPPTFTPALQRAAVSASATLEYVARNALASVYAVRLPPGCVGVDLKFRNETRPAGRVEVAMVRGGPAAAGVRVGDVVLAFGGAPLPKGASAVELEDVVSDRDDAREAVPAVLVAWRNEGQFAFGAESDAAAAWRGDDVVAEFPAGGGGGGGCRASLARWAATGGAGPGGAPLVVLARPLRALEAGLVLVAVNHEPLPDGLPVAELAARLGHYERVGPVTLTLRRLGSRKTRAALLRHVGADAGRRHADAPRAPPWWLGLLSSCDLTWCA